jgi:hypothetical protein
VVHDPIILLAQLIVVALIAVGAIWLVFRGSPAAQQPPTETVRGYPPGRFPNQEIVRRQALALLVATQSRLLTVYERLPARSPLAGWLANFLHELRGLMDTAYQIAAVTEVYGSLPQLEELAQRVQEIEHGLANAIVRQLMHPDPDAVHQLNPYLDALRQVMHGMPYDATNRLLDEPSSPITDDLSQHPQGRREN